MFFPIAFSYYSIVIFFNYLPTSILIYNINNHIQHWDHAGGNLMIKAQLPNVEIYGSTKDDVESCTNFIEDGSELKIGSISIKCILTSGMHGQVAFRIDYKWVCLCIYTNICVIVYIYIITLICSYINTPLYANPNIINKMTQQSSF